MGRLTLNVLLSFAQFEREVIGERVRDKIAASKQKGIWVGGPVPLGYASVNKKLVIVPAEAETVRFIFRRYLELGSIRSLIQDLDRKGIRTKRRPGANGRSTGGIRFGVGPLAHLLRNRFYVGEVVYRGKMHSGEHEPILDGSVFEAVQAKLASSAAARQLRLKASPAILAGRIFDDRGNRMTPTHTNKRGARYRYYVSHAVMQKRAGETGSVSRVPAPEIEALVIRALRERFASEDNRGAPGPADDRDLIERQLDRLVIKAHVLEIYVTDLRDPLTEPRSEQTGNRNSTGLQSSTIITVPWSAMPFSKLKGVLHSPSPSQTMSSGVGDAALAAIAKARVWIDELMQGRVVSFVEIAHGEGKVERHIRLLAPLAFVSPRIISEIIGGSVPVGLTVTGLAKRLAYSWAEQERERPSGS
jgi:hypothetical protein